MLAINCFSVFTFTVKVSAEVNVILGLEYTFGAEGFEVALSVAGDVDVAKPDVTTGGKRGTVLFFALFLYV